MHCSQHHVGRIVFFPDRGESRQREPRTVPKQRSALRMREPNAKITTGIRMSEIPEPEYTIQLHKQYPRFEFTACSTRRSLA